MKSILAVELVLGTKDVVAVRIDLERAIPDVLSPAEREVALGMLKGMSTQDIAALRGISTSTVNNQIASIFEKTGINSRSEFSNMVARNCTRCVERSCTACVCERAAR